MCLKPIIFYDRQGRQAPYSSSHCELLERLIDAFDPDELLFSAQRDADTTFGKSQYSKYDF